MIQSMSTAKLASFQPERIIFYSLNSNFGGSISARSVGVRDSFTQSLESRIEIKEENNSVVQHHFT